MPIPCATFQDVALRGLLELQVEQDFCTYISLEDLAKKMSSTGKFPECEPTMESVHHGLQYWKNHRHVEFTPDEKSVRLTSIGVMNSLLFEKL